MVYSSSATAPHRLPANQYINHVCEVPRCSHPGTSSRHRHPQYQAEVVHHKGHAFCIERTQHGIVAHFIHSAGTNHTQKNIIVEDTHTYILHLIMPHIIYLEQVNAKRLHRFVSGENEHPRTMKTQTSMEHDRMRRRIGQALK
jgi:hypothetical protein